MSFDASKVAAATKAASTLTGPKARLEFSKEIQTQTVEMAMFQQFRNVGQFKCVVLQMEPDVNNSGTSNSSTQGIYTKRAFLRPIDTGIAFPFPEPCQLAMNKTKNELLFYIRQHPLARSKNVVFDSEQNLPTAGDVVFAHYTDPSNYRSLTFEARSQGTAGTFLLKCLRGLQGETTTAKQLYGNSGRFGEGASIRTEGLGAGDENYISPAPAGGVTSGTMADIGTGKWAQFWPSGIIGIRNKPEEIAAAQASIPADALNAAYNRIDYFMNTKMYKEEKKFVLHYGARNEKKGGGLKKPNLLSIFDHRKPASEKRMWVMDITNRAAPKLVAHSQVGNGGQRSQRKKDQKSHPNSYGYVGNCCNRSSLGLSVGLYTGGTVGKGYCAKGAEGRTAANKYGCLDRFAPRRDGSYPCLILAGLEPWNGMQYKRGVMVHQTGTRCKAGKYVADVQGAKTYCTRTEATKKTITAWTSFGCWTTTPKVHNALMEWGWKGGWHYAYNGGPAIQDPKDVDNDCYYSSSHWKGSSGANGTFTVKSKVLGHELTVTGGKISGQGPRTQLGHDATSRRKPCLPYPVY